MSQNHNFKRILILKFKFKKIIKIVYWKNANLFVKFATTTNCNNIQKVLNKSKSIIQKSKSVKILMVMIVNLNQPKFGALIVGS